MRTWTRWHRQWLAQLALPHRAQQVTLEDYRLAVDQIIDRIGRLERQLLELVGESRFAEIIAALQALYGVGFITAVTGGHRGEGLRSFLAYAPVDWLYGAGCQRVLQRRQPASGLDHQVWQRSPAAGASGSRLALPTATQRHAGAQEAGPESGGSGGP